MWVNQANCTRKDIVISINLRESARRKPHQFVWTRPTNIANILIKTNKASSSHAASLTMCHLRCLSRFMQIFHTIANTISGFLSIIKTKAFDRRSMIFRLLQQPEIESRQCREPSAKNEIRIKSRELVIGFCLLLLLLQGLFWFDSWSNLNVQIH